MYLNEGEGTLDFQLIEYIKVVTVKGKLYLYFIVPNTYDLYFKFSF